MALIQNVESTDFRLKEADLPEFAWQTGKSLSELAGSKQLDFNFRSLDPGKYSYPYHFHHEAEEIFVILSGEATLRTPGGFKPVKAGDVIFFETGPEGAHQLYNHSASPCIFIDLRSNPSLDLVEMPDSGKINILPMRERYERESAVDYFKGEENVAEKWKGVKDV